MWDDENEQTRRNWRCWKGKGMQKTWGGVEVWEREDKDEEEVGKRRTCRKGRIRRKKERRGDVEKGDENENNKKYNDEEIKEKERQG